MPLFPLWPLSPEYYNLRDSGAIGAGADETSAINSVSATVSSAGGGTVLFPYPSSGWSYTFTLPAVNVQWRFAGGLTDRTLVGGSASQKFHYGTLLHMPGSHTSYRQVATYDRVIVEGSTMNGPASADAAREIHIEKANYLTTSVAGEVDGLWILVRNGGPNTGEKSGTGGIIIDSTSVDGSGFNVAMETATKVVDSSNTTLKYIDMQWGVADSRSSEAFYGGAVAEAVTGAFDVAFYAFENGGTFTDFLRISVGGIIRYKVGNTGKTTWKTDNSGNTEINVSNTSGVLSWANGGGATLGKVQQTGFALSDYVSAQSGAVTIAATDTGTTFTNEGATAIHNFNLPVAAVGLNYTFVVQDADGMTINAQGDDTIRVGYLVSAAAGNAQSTDIGAVLKLVAINSTEWLATFASGEWGVT